MDRAVGTGGSSPKAGALPGCATPRLEISKKFYSLVTGRRLTVEKLSQNSALSQNSNGRQGLDLLVISIQASGTLLAKPRRTCRESRRAAHRQENSCLLPNRSTRRRMALPQPWLRRFVLVEAL
jgi:hypothetical protein